jgi:hypothetical protein
MNFVLPLFTNINSVEVTDPHMLKKFQNEYSELAIPMFTSARVLFIRLVGFHLKIIDNHKFSFPGIIAVTFGSAIG